MDTLIKDKILAVMRQGRTRAESTDWFRVAVGLYYLAGLMTKETIDFKTVDRDYNRFIYHTLGGGHTLKLALLVFGMTVFFVTSMAAVILDLPKERFDHARSLGMSEWRVVWEVVILGTADEAFEVLRQNAAIGWMMLTMVEGISRAEGGIGAMLLNQNKHFHIAEVFAIQIVILAVGIAQDYAIGALRSLFCPYAVLTLERK